MVKWEKKGKKKKMQVHSKKICPLVMDMLKYLIVNNSSCCLPTWVGGNMYEVEAWPDRFVVDLKACKCTRRKWQRSGLPCIHVISCIFINKQILNILWMLVTRKKYTWRHMKGWFFHQVDQRFERILSICWCALPFY